MRRTWWQGPASLTGMGSLPALCLGLAATMAPTQGHGVQDAVGQLAGIQDVRVVVIQQSGEVVARHASEGTGLDTPVNIKSASKSILGALAGIALREGYVETLDDPIRDYLPEYFDAVDDARKGHITFRHLLTQSSGLRSTSFANYGAWVTQSDWTRAALEQPLEATPGQRMSYSTGDTHLLAAALQEAVGQDLKRFADEHLFAPLGARVAAWDEAPEGYRFGGNNLAVTPRALLAFGQLYLDGGSAGEREILPEGWVEASLSVHFRDVGFVLDDHDYGLLWWHTRLADTPVWFAWGHGGQYLFVLPEHDTLALVLRNPEQRDTAGNRAVYEIVENELIPALRDAAAIPPHCAKVDSPACASLNRLPTPQ